MKHVVFMTFVGLAIFAYMHAHPFVLIGWVAFTIGMGLFTGILQNS